MLTATQTIILYYANLLILQYLQKPKAYATISAMTAAVLMGDSTIQRIAFANAPASGNFKLTYGASSTVNIAWNASASTIATNLNAILIAPLAATVSGSITDGLTVTFTGNTSSIPILSITSNTLLDTNSVSVIPSVTPIGPQLPLSIQNAFNITGSNTAVGAQLDILGKYVGVSRSGFGFNGPITLDDADFLTFIQIAIIRNRSGSSLATIQLLLNQFFPGEVYVFDYANMGMSYLINTSIGSQNLIDLFVTEGVLPRPMAVSLSVIANSVIDKFFGLRTYLAPASSITTPFNNYSAYNTSWLWLTYAEAVSF